jgi:hypothetical protein
LSTSKASKLSTATHPKQQLQQQAHELQQQQRALEAAHAGAAALSKQQQRALEQQLQDAEHQLRAGELFLFFFAALELFCALLSCSCRPRSACFAQGSYL